MNKASFLSNNNRKEECKLKKFISNVALPVVAVAMIFKWRYKLLNMILGNDSIRRVSVKAAMGIPGVRSLVIGRAFRS